MIERLLVVLFWGFAGGQFSVSPIFPLIVYLGISIIHIVLKPYNKMYLNNRALVNMLVSMGIQAIYLGVNMMPEEQLH